MEDTLHRILNDRNLSLSARAFYGLIVDRIYHNIRFKRIQENRKVDVGISLYFLKYVTGLSREEILQLLGELTYRKGMEWCWIGDGKEVITVTCYETIFPNDVGTI